MIRTFQCFLNINSDLSKYLVYKGILAITLIIDCVDTPGKCMACLSFHLNYFMQDAGVSKSQSRVVNATNVIIVFSFI